MANNDFYHKNYKNLRCQLGIHNYINFLDSPIEVHYKLDIPDEVLMCTVCGTMTTPVELYNQQSYGEEDGD